MKTDLNIAFIGAGSMAEAMISGLLSDKKLRPNQITVTNHSNDKRLHELRNAYGINITRNHALLIEKSDIVMLAIKPKDVAESINTIKSYIRPHHLVLSVLAGVSTATIVNLFDQEVAVVRAMPNTSASIGLSATAIAPGKFATAEHMNVTTALFETIGTVTTVEEEQLHAVTGLSGSGPAYVYYLVEAMEKAAEKQGLDTSVSNELILQTLIGAAEMLKQSPKTPAVLRKEVMSPGGTTEAGIEQLISHNFQEAMMQCIEQATIRSKYLGDTIDEKISSKRS